MIIQNNVRIETEFHKNGKLQYRQYFVNGKTSRDPKDGPAYESFNADGTTSSRQYWVNANLTRDPKDGPAYETFHENGITEDRQYWVDGKQLTQAEVDAILKPKPDCEGLAVEIDGIKYKLSKA